MMAAGEFEYQPLQKFAAAAFPSYAVPVTEENFTEKLTANLPSPSLLLFTDKERTPPTFAALSANFRRWGVKFLTAHSSEGALLEQFKVTRVPSLLLVYQLKEDGIGSGEGPAVAASPYQVLILIPLA